MKQRTDCIDALRSHLQEFGYLAPQGIGYLRRLEDVIEDPNTDLPALARRLCRELLDHIAQLTVRIDALKKTIGDVANRGATSRRLQTMPGVGPISALAIETFAPPMEQFRRGRDGPCAVENLPEQQHVVGADRAEPGSRIKSHQ